MKGIIRNISIFSIGCLLLCGCGSGSDGNVPARVGVYNELHDVAKLELAQMAVGKVGTIADPKFSEARGFLAKAEALADKMKIGQRIGVYSYDTYLRATVDLSQLRPEDVEVDTINMTAKIVLPPVTVDYEGRDIQLKEEHYRVNGMRTDITPRERAALKEQMNNEVKREIAADTSLRNKLRDSAEARGRAYFTALLANWGYSADIQFRR